MEEIIKMLETLKKISNKISEIEVEEEPKFNFFSAIVSGKHSREHIEAYHSNFIANLLNPKQPHKRGNEFLNQFLELLKNVSEKNSEHLSILNKIASVQNQEFEVEREKPAFGSIDIFVHSKKEKWILFIENKVRSDELKDQHGKYFQVRDYCKWIEEEPQYKDWNWIGVFLTKDGHPPLSIKKTCYEKQVISLSYSKIINWLSNINIEDGKLKYAIEDYIQVIKKELNITIMSEKLRDFFKEIEKINDINLIAEIAANYTVLDQAIKDYIEKQRNLFLDSLVEGLKSKLLQCNYNPDDPMKDEKNKERFVIECKKGEKVFKIKIGQTYPRIEEDGRGLWWGIYPTTEGTFYNKLFEDSDGEFWKGISLKDDIGEFDDYKNTDRGSALIIKAMVKEELREGLISEITENIIDELDRVFDKIPFENK